MNWRQGVAKVRAFLESMYGLPSYDEERFRAEVHALIHPPDSQAEGNDNIIPLKEENDHRQTGY